jgi:hypothetical protein
VPYSRPIVGRSCLIITLGFADPRDDLQASGGADLNAD